MGDRMTSIDARNEPLEIKHVLQLRSLAYKRNADKIETHPSQWTAYKNLAKSVAESAISGAGEATTGEATTMGGLSVVERNDIPPTVIRAINGCGNVVAEISNLAIPRDFRG